MAYRYNDGSRSDELIKRMIPIMVLWAKYSWTEGHTYSQLAEAVEAKSPRLGHQLGLIDDIFRQLSDETGREIPTLNALISNANSGLPSNGFDYVDSNYSFLSKEDKETLAKGKNEEAHAYDYSWVLEKLGLTLPTNMPISKVNSLRTEMGKRLGGEGEYHKRMKEYISGNPEVLSISPVIEASSEYTLLSGDRLDVFIKTEKENWAVEVKSIISDDSDILRGIFQCVKYRSVMEAEKALYPNSSSIRVLLVVEREMSEQMKELADFLRIPYVSNFNIPS